MDRKKPKGISVFKLALPIIMSIIEKTAAAHIDNTIARKLSGYPNKKLIRNTNFISPSPIHLPLDTKNNITKKKVKPRAEINKLLNLVEFSRNFKLITAIVSNASNLSGIIR